MPDDMFDEYRVTSTTFLVEVDGVEIGRFMEISGLELTIETEPIAEGGNNGYVHRVPTGMSWPNIVLKRGVTQTNGLLEWVKKSAGEGFAAAGNKLTRSTAAVTLMGPRSDQRIRSWSFEGAMPVKWSGPNFSVTSTEAAVETLEFTHEGFRVTDHKI